MASSTYRIQTRRLPISADISCKLPPRGWVLGLGRKNRVWSRYSGNLTKGQAVVGR
jgi:hypothetical protein